MAAEPKNEVPVQDTSLQDAWRQVAGELGAGGAFGASGSGRRDVDFDDLGPMDQVSLFTNRRTYPCKDSFQRLQACYMAESSKCEQRWKETGKCLGNNLRSLWKYRPARFVCQKELRRLQEFTPADSLEYAEFYERVFFSLWDCWTNKFQHFRKLEGMLIDQERVSGAPRSESFGRSAAKSSAASSPYLDADDDSVDDL